MYTQVWDGIVRTNGSHAYTKQSYEGKPGWKKKKAVERQYKADASRWPSPPSTTAWLLGCRFVDTPPPTGSIPAPVGFIRPLEGVVVVVPLPCSAHTGE